MLLSESSLKTLREEPKINSTKAHKLLLRAGYIRQESAGIYTYLTLGLRVLENIKNIVKKHHENIGYVEVLFPALLPAETFKKTGRWDDFGNGMYKLKDRTDSDFLLAPTHEEVFTLYAKSFANSYKDYPIKLYQLQTKYRDELRPRAGLLRGKEFVMKDAYSFDIEKDGWNKSYDEVKNTYVQIFKELNFNDIKIVNAVSGAMGGSKSEEFLLPDESGEDIFAESDDGYLANVETLIDDNPFIKDAEIGSDIKVKTEVGEKTVRLKKATELGHIFQLGQKYSKSLDLTVLDKNGKKDYVWASSFGIGISRVLAVLAEKYATENGFMWPKNISPFENYIIVQPGNEKALEYAYSIEKKDSKNIFVDDRNDISMGVKFKDADLFGNYKKTIIGKKYLENSEIEIIEGEDRKTIKVKTS